MGKMYDVIVIGGGPAGIMAAITAEANGAKTLLIEKGDRLGRKLAISGGGRCNVTNNQPLEQIIKHIPGNGKFLYSAFSQFNNQDLIRFFLELGIELKEEDHGRMFPKNNSALEVVRVLTNKLNSLGVVVMFNSEVKDVLYAENKVLGVELTNKEKILANNVIIATGGKSVPQTGSTGDGYIWAKKGGHQITDLYPTEVPLISNADFIKEKRLQGLSLRDINLSVLNEKGKALITHRWDVIFTHFGISGPAALRCSQFVVKELKKGRKEVELSIDLFPEKSKEEIEEKIISLLKDDQKKSIKNVLKNQIPERLLLYFLERLEIKTETTFANLKKEKIRDLVRLMKEFRLYVQDVFPLEKAFVTGGGVSLKEVDPKTFASKLVQGLYFAGEVLDLHGYTGGYNITIAFVTGYVAGKNASNKYSQ